MATKSAETGKRIRDGDDSAEEVTLLYQRPGYGMRRHPTATACFVVSGCAASSDAASKGVKHHQSLAAVPGPDGDTLSFQNVPPELQFFRRCADMSHLAAAARNCGVTQQVAAAVPFTKAAAPQECPALFLLSEDRLRTAMQASVDLKGLLRCAPDRLLGSWVPRTHFRAAVALAALCDAAVPTRQQALISIDDHTFDQRNATAVSLPSDDSLVLSPVTNEAVTARIACLRRVWQLRFFYGMVTPLLHTCGSMEDLHAVLFSSPGGAHAAGTFQVVPPIGSRHRAEMQILTEVVAEVNRQCAIDTASWGQLAQLPPLHLQHGVYVVHHASRRRSLSSLLQEEADLYGLPPFLRSIRKTTSIGMGWDQPPTAPSHRGVPSTDGARCGATHVSYNNFFLCPEDLNAEEFTAPDAMQALIVQEEIISISLKHCALGVIIGEADQILYLFKAWGEHDALRRVRHVKWEADASSPTEEIVKAEMEELLTEVPGRRRAVLRDPLAPFVRETAVKARAARQQTTLPPAAAVSSAGAEVATRESVMASPTFIHWLCENRWSSDMTCYALTFVVVLQSEFSEEGVTPAMPMTVEASDSDEGRFEEVSYYVNTVLELSR